MWETRHTHSRANIHHILNIFTCDNFYEYFFLHRIEYIQEFLRTAQTYKTLGLSQIEGIHTYNARFELLVTNLKKKGYDPLEHRKPDFDNDFFEFKAQLKDFEV